MLENKNYGKLLSSMTSSELPFSPDNKVGNCWNKPAEMDENIFSINL